MRHIPEEELHACLDQALSRSQCVEIESHLAECARCRGLRDEIAALRDRTTALLASLGPEILQPPPFEAIRARRDLQVFERRRWLTRGAWAASVLLSLATGWQADRWLHASTSIAPVSLTATPAAPVAVPAGVEALEIASTPAKPETTRAHRKAIAARPTPTQTAGARTPSTGSRPREEENQGIGWTGTWADFRPEEHLPTLEISSLPRSTASLNLAVGGLWRTISLDGTSGDDGSQVARLSGLPVLQVQVQMRGQDREITAVDQQLSTGEMVRTIEGPAAEVAALISRQEGPSASSATNWLANPRDQATLTLRQGDRMLAVTGPSNVLGTLMNRVNRRRRY